MKKKTKHISPNSESEIWDLDKLTTIIKYKPSKRNKAAIALMWELNAKNHEDTLVRNKHILLRERYREGEIPHQKTGSGPILLKFPFLNVRDWLNEHPFCNIKYGRFDRDPCVKEVLWTMLKHLNSRISKLIESDSIADERENKILRALLTISRRFSLIACAKVW